MKEGGCSSNSSPQNASGIESLKVTHWCSSRIQNRLSHAFWYFRQALSCHCERDHTCSSLQVFTASRFRVPRPQIFYNTSAPELIVELKGMNLFWNGFRRVEREKHA